MQDSPILKDRWVKIKTLNFHQRSIQYYSLRNLMIYFIYLKSPTIWARQINKKYLLHAVVWRRYSVYFYSYSENNNFRLKLKTRVLMHLYPKLYNVLFDVNGLRNAHFTFHFECPTSQKKNHVNLRNMLRIFQFAKISFRLN